MNSGTNHPEDYGKNKGTFYGNWFDNTVQRNPRIGYGLGHIFNNYTATSQVMLSALIPSQGFGGEQLFFNVNNPFSQMYSGNDWDASYARYQSEQHLRQIAG